MIIIDLINYGNSWVKVIPNKKTETISALNPVFVANTLNIAVGRIRKSNIGSKYLQLFTVGDQLLWGAAEPIRRVLKILLEL